MRKVSRANETSELNFRTAGERRCSTPHCWNDPESGASHCAEHIESIRNPTSRPYETKGTTKGTTSSAKIAGAWPSEVDHNTHIASMEELADHHSKGVAWHSKQGDITQAGRHAAALAALTGAIEACKIAR